MLRVWAATWDTIESFPAPRYCAVRVDPAIARPMPNAIIRNMTGKLMETAATAAPPSRPTQKASMT